MARKLSNVEATAIPWKEFIAGYQVAMAALMEDGNALPVTADAGSVAAAGLGDLVDGDSPLPYPQEMEDEVRLKVKSDPYSRVLLALRENFGPRYAYYRPLLYRFWGLYDLVHRERLAEWVHPRDDGTLGLHPALLLAASEVKLTKKHKFPLDRFRDRVAHIIANEMARPDSPASPAPNGVGEGVAAATVD